MPIIVCIGCDNNFSVPQYRLKMKTVYCSMECKKAHTQRIRKEPITQEYIKSILNYDSLTGFFTWKDSAHAEKKKRAGWIDPLGYLHLTIRRKRYLAHRVAWLYIYGVWPEKQLDHINCISGDNRIENLRESTQQENTFNTRTPKTNTSGFKGVAKKRKKWRAYVSLDGKQRNLGVFDTPEEAYARVCEERKILHGEFARVA